MAGEGILFREQSDQSPREIRYLNSGDWVESLTAIVEHHDGRLELVHHEQFMAELAAEVRPERAGPAMNAEIVLSA